MTEPKCYGNCWKTCKCASCDCQYQCEIDTDNWKTENDELEEKVDK